MFIEKKITSLTKAKIKYFPSQVLHYDVELQRIAAEDIICQAFSVDWLSCYNKSASSLRFETLNTETF